MGVPEGTVYGWIKAFKEGRLSATEAVHMPKNALSLNEELIELRKRLREQEKENRRLKEENEFLEEASHRKFKKTKIKIYCAKNRRRQ